MKQKSKKKTFKLTRRGFLKSILSGGVLLAGAPMFKSAQKPIKGKKAKFFKRADHLAG